MKRKHDLQKRLNLSYLDLTNKTWKVGEFDFPKLLCNPSVLPDYIALYTQPSEYHKTSLTCLAFYNYDDTFDGINGLYNAIYYNDKKRLDFYKKRFEGIKFFIMPDYSVCGDIDRAENIHRLAKARRVALWLTLELNAVVFPNISYSCRKDFDCFLDGLEDVQYVAFSTKGTVNSKPDRELLVEAIQLVTDKLNCLKGIVVYDVCKDNAFVEGVFSYAKEHGIEIFLLPNSLKLRNMSRKERAA